MLASEILHKPHKVMIGNRDELKGNQDVTQQTRLVDPYQKNNAIPKAFDSYKNAKLEQLVRIKII